MPNAVIMLVSRISIYILLLLDIYTITSHTIWNVYLKRYTFIQFISLLFFYYLLLFGNNIFLKIVWTHYCLIQGITILYYGHIGASHHQQVSQVRNTKPPQTNVALAHINEV